MARRKRKKKKTSVFGALIIEALAVIVFVVLFTQARAQRQQEAVNGEATPAALEVMFEQTPFHDLVAQNQKPQNAWTGISVFSQDF